jgi:hypothetical protein
MEDKKFDPRKFIDRTFEQDLFEDLLKFNDYSRVLAICDGGGMGKSQLLQKLQHRCLTVKPHTPVSLIALDQLPDNNPLKLIEKIADDLTNRFNVQFPNFEELYSAQASGDFGLIRSSVFLQGADFRNSRDVRIASYQVNADKVDNLTLESRVEKLTSEQQEIANRVCIRAYFNDIKEYCAKDPDNKVVLMLDAYEKCQVELKEWIVDYLLARHFFDLDHRPTRLALVLAGRKVPEFEMKWALEDIKAVVKSRQLGKWGKKDVEECLRAHGFIYEANHLEMFWTMIQSGMPPSLVVEGMHSILRRQQ